MDESSSHSPPLSYIGDRSRFRRNVAADATGAAQIRVDFEGWLQRHFALSEERLNDLVLAVNEALANAAEFAYVDEPGSGSVQLCAEYDAKSNVLTVAIEDQGRWRPAASVSDNDMASRLRGRGIPLMHALADKATIETTTGGTHVTLVWRDLERAKASANAVS